MNRIAQAACLLLPFVIAGCGAWPNETRIASRNWAHPKMNQNAGPSYCYKTLAAVQCTAKPLSGPAASRLMGAYSTKQGPTVNGTPPPEIYQIQKRKKGWFARGYAKNSANLEGNKAQAASRRTTTANDWNFLEARPKATAKVNSGAGGGVNGGVEFAVEPPEKAAAGKGPQALQ